VSVTHGKKRDLDYGVETCQGGGGEGGRCMCQKRGREKTELLNTINRNTPLKRGKHSLYREVKRFNFIGRGVFFFLCKADIDEGRAGHKRG